MVSNVRMPEYTNKLNGNIFWNIITWWVTIVCICWKIYELIIKSSLIFGYLLFSYVSDFVSRKYICQKKTCTTHLQALPQTLKLFFFFNGFFFLGGGWVWPGTQVGNAYGHVQCWFIWDVLKYKHICRILWIWLKRPLPQYLPHDIP